jgi:hypothetical protein
MHCLSLVYSVTIPLHVASWLGDRLQEVAMYVYVTEPECRESVVACDIDRDHLNTRASTHVPVHTFFMITYTSLDFYFLIVFCILIY